MQRFAANLAFMFAEHPMMARFGAAAAAGFKAVELQFPYDLAPTDVRAELQRHGLTQLGINTQPRPNGGESGLGAVPGREREFAEAFQKALDYVVAIGGTAIHTMAGVVPPEQRPAAERVFVANYTHAADLAAEKNITLLIEPLNPRDRPDYFVGRVEQAADLIAQIGRPNVKIQFDFYHVQIICGDLLTRFERFLPVIGHVQIAAVPSRAEPDEGEVNFAAVFDALDRLGYAGWIGCEYKPRGRTEDGLGWGKTYGLGS
jgi:2-dehydrotetronate isomerase